MTASEVRGIRIEQVVGMHISSRRRELQLTQEELGQRLGDLLGRPWSRQAVSAAEKGGRSFDAEELLGLALVLQQPVSRFFELHEYVGTISFASGSQVTDGQVRRLALLGLRDEPGSRRGGATKGFPSALGVVCVELSTGSSFASPPGTLAQATEYAGALRTTVLQVGDGTGMVWLDYGQGEGPGVWLRARDVTAIEVVSTEDPSA